MEEVVGITLDQLAGVTADLELGTPLERSLADAQISPIDWDFAQEVWLAWLADEATRERYEPVTRYHRLLAEKRAGALTKVRARARRLQGEVPADKAAILSPLAAEHRSQRAVGPAPEPRAPQPLRSAEVRAAGAAQVADVRAAGAAQVADVRAAGAARSSTPQLSPAARPKQDLGGTLIGTFDMSSDLPFAGKKPELPFVPAPSGAAPGPKAHGGLPFAPAQPGHAPQAPPRESPAPAQGSDPLSRTTSEAVSPFTAKAATLPFKPGAGGPVAPPKPHPLSMTTSEPILSPFSARGGALPFAPGGQVTQAPAPPRAQPPQGGLPFAQHANLEQRTSPAPAAVPPAAPPVPPSNTPAPNTPVPNISISQYAWLEASIERARPGGELNRLLSWCKLTPEGLQAVRGHFARQLGANPTARAEYEQALAGHRKQSVRA